MSRPSASAVLLAALSSAVLVVGVAAAATYSPLEPRVPPPPAALPPSVLPLAVPAPAPARPAAYDPGNPATWSTRQLAAQLVFSCVPAGKLGTAAEHARAGLGGIAVMGRPTDRGAITRALAAVRASGPHGIAPLIASDEEGGRVQRLKDLLGPLPTAKVMGTWSDARIEQTAYGYGAGMRALGVQMALSPVADLGVPGFYPEATQRAFSRDPHRVAGAAVAWSRGLQRAGVLSAVKHWPGHGEARDSHTQAPAVPPLAVLERRDLVPFDAVHRSGAKVVMIGHLRSAGLTEPGLPATLSPNAMRVLRARTGPQSVLLTDSVSMAASSSALGLRPADAAVRALQAGADWAMSCVNPLLAVDAIQAALDGKRLPREAAVASARRVLAVKHGLGLLRVAPTTSAPTGALEAAELRGSLVRLSGRAVDADTPKKPPVVRVLVDGVAVTEVRADGEGQRFAVEVPTTRGSRVCATVLNTGRGAPTSLGCVTRPDARSLRGGSPDSLVR